MNTKNSIESAKPGVWDDFEYTSQTLLFLRSKLDDFTIDCFRMVSKKHNDGGFAKTKIEDYNKSRKKMDTAFLILEYQGFIETKAIATMKPYYVTKRGFQLITLLKEEKQKRNREGQ